MIMMNSQYFRLLAIAIVIATLFFRGGRYHNDSIRLPIGIQISPLTVVAAGIAELLLVVAWLSILAATAQSIPGIEGEVRY